jgi:hypothetical protein
MKNLINKFRKVKKYIVIVNYIQDGTPEQRTYEFHPVVWSKLQDSFLNYLDCNVIPVK